MPIMDEKQTLYGSQARVPNFEMFAKLDKVTQ